MYNSMQVLCTLGSVVFVSILLIRGIWSGVSFLHESRHQEMDQLYMHHAWNGGQPVTWAVHLHLLILILSTNKSQLGIIITTPYQDGEVE